jgi:hypothetical protein
VPLRLAAVGLLPSLLVPAAVVLVVRLTSLLVTQLLSPLLVVMCLWLVALALQAAVFSSVAVRLLAKTVLVARFRWLAVM